MNDAQAIDHLNTIINERESAVALKAVLERAISAEGRASAADARCKDLEKQAASYPAKLLTLESDYQHKRDQLEDDLDIHRRSLAAAKVDLSASYEEYKKQTTAQIDALTTDLQGAQLATTKANDACGVAYAKKRECDAELAAAVKKYEDYKASLK